MWFWTDYLVALVGVYAAFLITACLFQKTKFGEALIDFASEPRPTSAVGWLEMEFGKPKRKAPPALVAAPAAAAKQPAVEGRRRRRKHGTK
jgi:hypothetical protein